MKAANRTMIHKGATANIKEASGRHPDTCDQHPGDAKAVDQRTAGDTGDQPSECGDGNQRTQGAQGEFKIGLYINPNHAQGAGMQAAHSEQDAGNEKKFQCAFGPGKAH